MAEPVAPSSAAPRFYQQPQFWGALTAFFTILGMTCPLWPQPVACVAISESGKRGAELGRQVTQRPPALEQRGAEVLCEEGKLTTRPSFCRCVSGRWADYFDGGACGP